MITALRDEALSGIPMAYMISLSPSKITITDEEDRIFNVSPDGTDTPPEDLPFSIALNENTEETDYQDTQFKVVISPMKGAIMGLAKSLEIGVTNKESDIVSLTLEGQSPDHSEAILNAIIAKFDQDGILDRQLVSKRTLEVIDKRFVYLSGELDSIEIGKQDFKQANKLSYIEADAGISLQKKSDTENELKNSIKYIIENRKPLNRKIKSIELSNKLEMEKIIKFIFI